MNAHSEQAYCYIQLMFINPCLIWYLYWLLIFLITGICLDSNPNPAHSSNVLSPTFECILSHKTPHPIPTLIPNQSFYHKPPNHHHHQHQIMAQSSLSLLLSLTPFLILISQINAQSTTAPAPASAGPIDIIAILTNASQYTVFIRLLNQTQVGNQINNQVNHSSQGMTVFAPTDNAFQNLPPGALNNLTTQQQVQLVLYHVLSQFYTLQNLATASNPVRTQASGNDGKPFGLYFSGEANQNQVNVSTGVVQTTIYNTVRKDFPMAVFEVDKVLWPSEFNQSKAAAAPPSASPTSSTPKSSGSSSTTTAAAGPSPGKSDAQSVTVGLSLVSGLWLLCMGVLF